MIALGEWKVEKLDHDLGYMFHYYGSKHFIFDFDSFNEVMNALLTMRERDAVLITKTGRLNIDSEGLIRVIDVDAWLNPNWSFNEVICHVNYLIEVIVEYTRYIWTKK